MTERPDSSDNVNRARMNGGEVICLARKSGWFPTTRRPAFRARRVDPLAVYQRLLLLLEWPWYHLCGDSHDRSWSGTFT